MLGVAMVGLAVGAVGAAPAYADHVRVGSGFLGESRGEWDGPSLHFTDRGAVDFLAGSDVAPKLRGPRRNPDVPRGPGNNRGRGNGQDKQKDEPGFFNGDPTVVLPDVTAPSDGGFLGAPGSGGPTATSPEPGTLLLLGAGLGGAVLLRRRRAEA
jgi:hypothetical protein